MSSPPLSPASVFSPRPARRGLRVFVVDAHEDTLESLALLLPIWGHEVTTARNGKTALKLLDTYVPDVILLEVLLPGVCGWDLTRHVRSRPEFESTRIIVLSSQARDADRRRSAEVGADLHLVKPLEPALLEELLNE